MNSNHRLLAVSFLAASFGAFVFACSSSTSGPANAGGANACATLSSCCASIGGATGSSCQTLEQSVSGVANGSTSCQDYLESYQAAGYCGGLDGGSGTTFDSGGAPTSSCTLTGTCDSGTTTGPTAPQCQLIGSCANGETYGTCVQTSAGGACSASIVFSGGTQIACVSCTDCAAASATAAAECNPTTPGEDAAAPVDSGPSCGTAPVLHPETTPGTYCPFTATGAVHCAAGQECCEAPSGGTGSTCEDAGATCPITGSLDWACADPLDCEGNAAGSVCCAVGGTTAYDSTCGFYRGTGFTGSVCAASCGAGQVQLCSAANDPCVSPNTCTPFKTAGLVLGTCL
jgi:hypothetical protein